MVKERGGLVDFIPIFLVVEIGIFWVFLLRIYVDANPSKSMELVKQTVAVPYLNRWS